MNVLDNLNKKYGTNTVRLDIQDKQKWKMRQDLLSPKYTTDMKDIITIRV